MAKNIFQTTKAIFGNAFSSFSAFKRLSETSQQIVFCDKNCKNIFRGV